MIKIAVTGPESTGKTTLAQNLADYYKVEWAREFARDFLKQKEDTYSFSDLDTIADGQVKNIEALKNNQLIIADTEMTVMKIWSEFKFGECSNHINALWDEQNFDLYLLCSPDIPYEPDPLREHEEFREELFEIYHNVLLQMKVNFIVVNGDLQTRMNQSIAVIDQLQNEDQE